MATIAPPLRHKFTDDDGNPLVGGFIQTYVAGSTTPLATYTDAGALTQNSNPIELDANGECDLWLGTTSYKFVIMNSDLEVLKTIDYVAFPTVDNGFSTGDVKFSLKTVADTGWVLMNDLTIGNAASSATGRANADTLDLYTLLWNNTINTWCAVSTGRGASAAADFAANKTIALPKALGRALAIYGSGSGLTARVMAQVLGVETHTLSTAEIPSHNHTQDSHNHTQNAHSHNFTGFNAGAAGLFGGYQNGNQTDAQATTSTTATNNATTATNQATGGGGAHQNMQPTLFLNMMIKL